MNHVNIGLLPKTDYTTNEAMNTLATNIAFSGDDIHVIEITSRFAQEGKSFVIMNLMNTFASLDKRVVLVDADLRRSNLQTRHRMTFDTEKPNGLVHYLAGMCTADDIIYETNVENAYYIPIGRQVNHSLRLVSKPAFGALLDYLESQFDIVLVDTPPAGTIVDAVEISKYCDGAMIVVGYGMGNKHEINEVANSISKTGCQVLGAVINKVDMESISNRKYYYYKGYYNKYYKGYTKR